VPYFPNQSIPTLPNLHLSEDDQGKIARLMRIHAERRQVMELKRSLYLGTYSVANLKIAVPDEVATKLNTLVGWSRIAVDPYVERTRLDGFRLPNDTDENPDLMRLWTVNGMHSQMSMGIKDALSMGSSWLMADGPLKPGERARLAVESPLNVTAGWDSRGTTPVVAWQNYWAEDHWAAAWYKNGLTTHLAQNDKGEWEIVDTTRHPWFDGIPLRRMTNQPSTDDRSGESEIIPALESVIAAACRTLLALEVAREFYSVPQKVLLGASESAFQDTDGNAKSAWATSISHLLGLERDEEGNLPEIFQFKAYDPSVFTKLIEMYASQAAGILGCPPQDLGLYTQGNPVSAEAQQVSENRRDRRAWHQMNAWWGPPIIEIMQIALRFENKGKLPDGADQMEIDWCRPEIRNDTATADAVTKYVSQGIWVKDSDVTLAKSGLSALERQRMNEDREVSDSMAKLDQIVDGLVAPEKPAVPKPSPELFSGNGG